MTRSNRKLVAAALDDELVARGIGAVDHLGVLAGAAVVEVGAVAVVPDDGVVAVAAVVLVGAPVADQDVVAGVAVQLVVARAAEQLVVAVAAPGLDRDLRGAGIEAVVARRRP